MRIQRTVGISTEVIEKPARKVSFRPKLEPPTKPVTMPLSIEEGLLNNLRSLSSRATVDEVRASIDAFAQSARQMSPTMEQLEWSMQSVARSMNVPFHRTGNGQQQRRSERGPDPRVVRVAVPSFNTFDGTTVHRTEYETREVERYIVCVLDEILEDYLDSIMHSISLVSSNRWNSTRMDFDTTSDSDVLEMLRRLGHTIPIGFTKVIAVERDIPRRQTSFLLSNSDTLLGNTNAPVTIRFTRYDMERALGDSAVAYAERYAREQSLNNLRGMIHNMQRQGIGDAQPRVPEWATRVQVDRDYLREELVFTFS